MNNNEETASNKDHEKKIDTPENNGVETNLENNLEKKIEELNDKLLRSLAENQNLRKIHEKEREDLIFPFFSLLLFLSVLNRFLLNLLIGLIFLLVGFE